MLLQGAQGGPYADVPPSTGSDCHWHPRFTSFLLSPTRWAVGVPTPPRHSLPSPPHPLGRPRSQPLSPALSPSAQLTDPGPTTQASGAALRDLPAPRLASRATWRPTLPWSAGEPCPAGRGSPLQGGRGEGGMLPASSLARRPEPLTARHTAGALRGCASWPGVAASSRLLPPPPAVQFPVQLSAIPDGGLLGGTTCLGGLGAQRGPGQPGPPQSPTSPGPRDPAVGGGRRPGCSGTFCMSPKSRPILPGQHHPGHPGGPATATALGIHVQPGHGPRGGDTRVRTASAKHSTSRSPVGQPSGSPRVGCGAQTPPPHILDTKQEPTVRAGGRRGRLLGTQGSDWPVALLAVCLRSSRPRGAPRPTRALCGVAFHTLPCLPSLAFSPNSKCPAAPHGPLPPAPERVLGPQTLPPRPLPPALSRELVSPPETMQVSVWVKFRNARFLGKSMCTVINSAFPRAPLRTQCRLRKCQEGQEASASGSWGLRGDVRAAGSEDQGCHRHVGDPWISGPAQGPSRDSAATATDRQDKLGTSLVLCSVLKASARSQGALGATSLCWAAPPVQVSHPRPQGLLWVRSEDAGAPALPRSPGAGSEDSAVRGPALGLPMPTTSARWASTPLT